MTTLDLVGDLDRLVADIAEELPRWQVPGLQLAVVDGNEVRYAGGVGVASVDLPAPVTSRTLFHHGSCGKAYTAYLATALTEAGLLDLDAPVRRYVPELVLPDPEVAAGVTTRDLLSHRSGLARHDLTWIFHPSWSREELLGRLAFLPMAHGLRAEWEYTNLGYALAGLVIERATGGTWDEQLQARVLGPAGMLRSHTSNAAMQADPDHAEPHVLRQDQPTRVPYRQLGAASPAGAVITCAQDAARWLQVQLAVANPTHVVTAPLPPGRAPLPELTLDGYGLGWLVGSYRDEPMLWHSGGVDGFLTQSLMLPGRGIGVLASANLHMTGLPLAAVLHLVDGLLGRRDQPDWFERLRVDPPPTSVPVQESTTPVLPLTACAGTFVDDGYGELRVVLDEQGLRIRLGEAELTPTHRAGQTWDLHYAALGHDLELTFVADDGITVTEAVVLLDPTTPPTRFRRAAQRGTS